jgi:hypothetical protein
VFAFGGCSSRQDARLPVNACKIRTHAPKKSIKSPTGAAGPQKPSKTAFVLSQSADLSASEVVAAGKAAGIEMSPAYVHTIRSAAKRRKGSKGRAGRPKGGKNKDISAPAATVGGLRKAEAQLLEWILEHGATAVQRMVDGVTERIRKLV